MASTTLLTGAAATIPRQSQAQHTFFGLRPVKGTDRLLLFAGGGGGAVGGRQLEASSSVVGGSSSRKLVSVRGRGKSNVGGVVGVTAELNPSLVISLSTGLSLFLGRFVFFNFQRENVAKQVPEQNGVTHFEAGDTRAKEYVALLKSNDPVGFNIVDVLAWGSIGHIVAYYILATSSNGYDPSFFG